MTDDEKMTAQTKSKLDELISEGKIQRIFGVIGCCMNYYVLFANETQKHMYNPNKSISGKLSNEISNYSYNLKSNMSSSSNANPEPAQSTGKRLSKKTKPSDTTYGKIHQKSVKEIIHMLGRTIKMKVTKSTPALKKNTHTIDVKPSYIGKNQDAHVEALLDKAFTEAKKLIKHKKLQGIHIFTFSESTRWG